MKKNEKDTVTENAKGDNKALPIKNVITDGTKNIASQTPGLNQEKTTRDDLFPSDGDNLTS